MTEKELNDYYDFLDSLMSKVKGCEDGRKLDSLKDLLDNVYYGCIPIRFMKNKFSTHGL